jgi:asparagine synthase (glutamine-hydrolysing)
VCGIAGLVAPPGRPADLDVVRAMTTVLAHRGPDADGYLVHDNAALGHRRLSIIDPRTTADQPLYNEDRSVAVVFNGEIYNFRDLRRELTAAGHRFATRTDSEVLVHLWEEVGPQLVERLRGMFAFALLDLRAGRLLLARDRFGQKPLYWARTSGGGLAFGSEIKALRAHPEVADDLDETALAQTVVYGYTVGEASVRRGIRKLLPGHRLLVDLDAPAAAEPDPYWCWRPVPDPALRGEAVLDEVDHLLAEAVRLRLVADVPLGAFLSGGIDSSLVVSHMTREAGDRVRTFAIAFREEGFDESGHARAVAEALGTEHREERVTPDAVEVLPRLLAAYDEPFMDPSAIPTWYLSRMTRRDVTVALSGDGGDELFLGYTRYRESAALERISRLLGPARPLARRIAGAFPRGSWAGRGLDRASRRGAALYLHAHGFSEVYLALLGPELAAALGEAGAQRMARAFDAAPELPFATRCQLADVAGYLPDDILVKVDRASMDHSLEVRSPFLDHVLAELAGRILPGENLGGGQTKRLLRRLAYRHLPRELLDRPKQGFAVPLARWFRHELAPRLESLLADESHPTWRFLDRAEAATRFRAHRAGRLDASTALWRVLVFGEWMAGRE